jgi:hypothetical protein
MKPASLVTPAVVACAYSSSSISMLPVGYTGPVSLTIGGQNAIKVAAGALIFYQSAV